MPSPLSGASQAAALESDRCQPGGGEEGMSDMNTEFVPNTESDASGLSNRDTIGSATAHFPLRINCTVPVSFGDCTLRYEDSTAGSSSR